LKIDPASYDAWYDSVFGSLCHRLERDALLSLARFKPGEKVLDAGCGTGVYLQELLRLGLDVTGVEEDKDMLGYAARGRGRGAVLVKASLLDLPFVPSSFDKVITVCTLEFTGDPSAVLKELSRVLKKDGVLLLGFLNKNSAWSRLRMKKGEHAGSVWHGVRFYSISEVVGIASSAGLRMTGFKGAVYFPPEAEGGEAPLLMVMESEVRQRSPSTAAFIGISFAKAGG
jgi:SAM-dependent methyltransferase